MIYLILILILIVIIFLLIIFREKIKRIIVYQSPKREKVEENKKKIVELLQKKPKITNDGVQKLLGVSDATATRYLDELEKEGRIKQVGRGGRFVYYETV